MKPKPLYANELFSFHHRLFRTHCRPNCFSTCGNSRFLFFKGRMDRFCCVALGPISWYFLYSFLQFQRVSRMTKHLPLLFIFLTAFPLLLFAADPYPCFKMKNILEYCYESQFSYQASQILKKMSDGMANSQAPPKNQKPLNYKVLHSASTRKKYGDKSWRKSMAIPLTRDEEQKLSKSIRRVMLEQQKTQEPL